MPPRRGQRRGGPSLVGVAHVLAAAVVVVGVIAQIARPLAPDLGPVPNPGRWFDAEYLERALAYREPLYRVAVAGLMLRLAVPLLIALTPVGRRVSNRLVDRIGEDRPARAAAVVVVAIVVITDVVVLPFNFWSGFVWEGEWGFRTQGLAGWSYDWLAARAPGWIAAAVGTLAAYTVIRKLPRTWPAVGALGGAAVAVVVVFAAPLMLEPLLFRMQPLPPGEVREEVTRVLERAGERVDRILVADASRRTTKRNAYVSGLGATRRVVLYDTLVEGNTPAEVGVVLAHELGHQRNRDLARGTMLGAAAVVAATYLLWGVIRRRVARGAQRDAADPRAAAALTAAVLVLSHATLPVQSYVSRRAEAAADFVALEIHSDPETHIQMQLTLSEANLSNPAPPRWVWAIWGTHPPAAARLQMAEQWPLTGAQP